MSLRRLLPIVAIVVFGAVPVALAADPFGAPEVADPVMRAGFSDFPDDAPVIGVDGAGNAVLASSFHDAKGNEQLAIYGRCGTTWQRTLLGTATADFRGTGLEVARNGTAMVVWREKGKPDTVYSSERPA